jgi:ABC-type polysaccharide/polyol phosphate export permease
MTFKPVDKMMHSKNRIIHVIGHYIAYLLQYRSIYVMMVKNDLKGRFRYTVLGYFWHLINPLSQIVIYYLIFTVIFGRDIPNYWVYICTGMFAFSFFLQSSAGCCNAIVGNTRMVTKMAMARELLVAYKVTTNLITLSISYILLAILILITGVGVTVYILYVPLIVIMLTVFCTGMAFALSAITVYLRDVANATNILFGCMLFALPILYIASQRASDFIELFWAVNPMYYFIETIHDAFYWGVAPDLFQIGVCALVAIVTFIFGLGIFKKLEPGFAERL